MDVQKIIDFVDNEMAITLLPLSRPPITCPDCGATADYWISASCYICNHCRVHL